MTRTDTIITVIEHLSSQPQIIEALMYEAGAAGDDKQVAVCKLALRGDEGAICECALAIMAASA